MLVAISLACCYVACCLRARFSLKIKNNTFASALFFSAGGAIFDTSLPRGRNEERERKRKEKRRIQYWMDGWLDGWMDADE